MEKKTRGAKLNFMILFHKIDLEGNFTTTLKVLDIGTFLNLPTIISSLQYTKRPYMYLIGMRHGTSNSVDQILRELLTP